LDKEQRDPIAAFTLLWSEILVSTNSEGGCPVAAAALRIPVLGYVLLQQPKDVIPLLRKRVNHPTGEPGEAIAPVLRQTLPVPPLRPHPYT